MGETNQAEEFKQILDAFLPLEKQLEQIINRLSKPTQFTVNKREPVVPKL